MRKMGLVQTQNAVRAADVRCVEWRMQLPLFVRPLAEAERTALRQGLRSPEAFTLRRCQILLASDQGQRPSRIAAALACGVQTVRDALHAFDREGVACL